MTFCRSDEAATSCAASLQTAACGTAVPCAVEVLDRQPAIDACELLLGATCEARLRCNSGLTREDCMAKARADVDCSTAIGVGPGYQACIDALSASSCEAPPTAQCTGVIGSAPPLGS